MYLKSRPGRVVFDPERTRLTQRRTELPPEGATVPDTQYWHKRVQVGDAEISSPPPDSQPAAEPEQ